MEKNREEAKRKLLEVTAFLKGSAIGPQRLHQEGHRN